MRKWRRLSGLVVAGAALAGAGVGTAAAARHARAGGQAESLRIARQALSSAEGELGVLLRNMEARASVAVSLSPVRALVAHPVDARTLQDGFRTEEWWRGFRSEFAIQSLVLGARRFDFTDDPAATAIPLAPLLALAEGRANASRLVAAGSTPYLAAVALVDVPVPPASRPAALVLARPLTSAGLEQIAGRVGARLAVGTDEGTVQLASSPPAREQFQALANARRTTAGASDGAWAAAASTVASGLVLWARVETPAARAAAQKAELSVVVPLWAGALLCAAGALVLGFRRRPDTARMLEQTTSRLADAHAELDRLSRHDVLPDLIQTFPPFGSPRDGVPAPVQLTQTARSPASSTPFGRYELLHVIGQGGMSNVHLAVAHGAEGFRRLFVVKRLREDLTHNPEAVGQFIDEARLGASLVHSNIVPVFDFGREADEYFLTQEYIVGRDLNLVVRRARERDGRALEPALVFYVAHETLKALGYAHTLRDAEGGFLQIVHRDISPMNVMVSARGEVKLLDFGIAKSGRQMAQTQAGVVKGNVLFMAPEQARGRGIDGRADLFSLALTMFWCLTGEPLYGSGSDYDLLVKAAGGPGPEEWERVDLLGPPASEILRRALQPSSADRFQTAEEFAAALPVVGMAGAPAGLRSLVQRLFGEDFAGEGARFSDLPAPPPVPDETHPDTDLPRREIPT